MLSSKKSLSCPSVFLPSVATARQKNSRLSGIKNNATWPRIPAGKVSRSIAASPGVIVLAHSRGFQMKEYKNLMKVAGLPRF